MAKDVGRSLIGFSFQCRAVLKCTPGSGGVGPGSPRKPRPSPCVIMDSTSTPSNNPATRSNCPEPVVPVGSQIKSRAGDIRYLYDLLKDGLWREALPRLSDLSCTSDQGGTRLMIPPHDRHHLGASLDSNCNHNSVTRASQHASGARSPRENAVATGQNLRLSTVTRPTRPYAGCASPPATCNTNSPRPRLPLFLPRKNRGHGHGHGSDSGRPRVRPQSLH